MERGLAGVWTCLLVSGFALAFSVTTPDTAFSKPPQLNWCVFVERRNVTCHWEPGDPAEANYTLRITQMPILKTFTCTTADTSCTVGIDSARFDFCITVTAHSGSQNISSERRCQSGRIEVMLPPVTLESVKAKRGSPSCLDVTWSRDILDFPVSESEIKDLNSQIQFIAQGQLDAQVRDVKVTGYSSAVCLFRPDTSYTISLRHRYRGPASPWSPWSQPRQGRTAEDAPSAAPAFWRQVNQTSRNGQRLVSLLWKPLPHFLANGRVAFYNVTCRSGSTPALTDHGSCRDLHSESASCSLTLPPGRCSCSLTASTSAGASPEATVWLLGAFEKDLPPPSQISARPLGDMSLDVRWAAPENQRVSGFVVEWFAVREQSSTVLHWERLNSSRTMLVITEGVRPTERYAVSVRALYGQQGAGENRSLHIYTKQGTPSAGPNVTVQRISGGSVELAWSPVPVELLGGFIRGYTLYYRNNTEGVFVPGNVHHYTLRNLSPGNYNIFMRANTDAGRGQAGAAANVHIGSEETWTVFYVVLPVVLTSLALMLMICLVQIKTVKQKLFKDVPDPSHSSLSHWAPETTMEGMKQLMVPENPEIKHSEVILLRELQDSDVDQDHGYQNAYRRLQYAPFLPVTTSEKMPFCPSVDIIYTQAVQSLPPPGVPCSRFQLSTVSDFNPPLDGASKPPASHLPPAADKISFHQCLIQHQRPVSLPGISSISHSHVSPAHLAGVSLPKHPFSQSSFNPDQLFDSTLTPSFSPFPQSLFVDFAYCSVDCGPYTSYNV